MNLNLQLPATAVDKKNKLYPFTVIDKQLIKDTFKDTFILKLKSNKNLTVQSGDLLAVYPPKDPTERLYSIGVDAQGNILLSIKIHKLGICSNYLNSLTIGDTLEAHLQKNKHFHFPNKSKSVTYIANGTGIAPFLGMIQEKKTITKIKLYWGGRTLNSFHQYQEILSKSQQTRRLESCQLAFSRVNSPSRYVQDLVKQDAPLIADQLESGGKLMICGSVAMQNDVLETLKEICQHYNQKNLSIYLNKNQILMDCY